MNINALKMVALLLVCAAANLPAQAQSDSPTPTAQQAQQTASEPPQGDLSAAEMQSMPSDTHLRLLNTVNGVAPGNVVTLQYQTEPGAVCTIKPEVSEALINDEQSKMANRNGKVTWTVQLDKAFKGSEIPLMVSSSHNGHNENIETRLSVKVASNNKATRM